MLQQEEMSPRILSTHFKNICEPLPRIPITIEILNTTARSFLSPELLLGTEQMLCWAARPTLTLVHSQLMLQQWATDESCEITGAMIPHLVG